MGFHFTGNRHSCTTLLVRVAGHASRPHTIPARPIRLWELLGEQGPVRALAVDMAGQYLATAGADRQVKVWDVRTFRPLQAYSAFNPPDALDISQRGLLAVGAGRTLQVKHLSDLRPCA